MLRQFLGVFAISSLLIAAPLSAAGAADVNMPMKAPYAPPPPSASWTGCYLDAGFGYGMWRQDANSEVTATLASSSNTTSFAGSGWLGRFGGGCDYQIPSSRFVVGLLGDYDVTGLSGQYMDPLSGFIGEEKETGAWAVGGRIGYLVTPNLLAYSDGGYTEASFAQVNFGPLYPLSLGGVVTMPANTYRGWFLGGGTEYALNFDWIPIRGLFWRSEYRYSSFQNVDLPVPSVPAALNSNCGPGGPGTAPCSDHISLQTQTITSGVVWRFNWTGR
jgi:outer membrane immunogenic protein